MKKIWLLITIIFLFFFLMITRAKSIMLKNITLNLKDNQLGITIIDDNNNRKLLLHLNKRQFIIKLDNPDLNYNNKSNKIMTLSDLEKPFIYLNMTIFFDENRLIINYNNKNLCVVTNDLFEKCDYVYLLDSKKNTLIPDNIDLVVYDKNIKEETILNNYSNWIDSIELKDNYYTTIIIDGIQYQTIRIPKKSINF